MSPGPSSKANAPKPAGEGAPEPKGLPQDLEALQQRFHLKKTTPGPSRKIRGPQPRLNLLEARPTLNLKKPIGLEPDPTQTLLWPGLDGCKKQTRRQERDQRSRRPKPEQGWSASGGGIIRFRVRACMPAHPVDETPRTLKPDPSTKPKTLIPPLDLRPSDPITPLKPIPLSPIPPLHLRPWNPILPKEWAAAVAYRRV